MRICIIAYNVRVQKINFVFGVYSGIPFSLKSCKHDTSQVKLKTKTIGLLFTSRGC